MPGEQVIASVTSLGISAGSIRQGTSQDTPGAVYREWEIAGKKDGRWELVFNQWSGIIEKVSVRDTQFGQQLSIKFDDAYLSVSTKSRYFGDLVTKLKNCDLSQPVTLKPYNFTDDNDKRREGVSVTQNGIKVESAYKEKTDDGKWKMLNGYPETTGKEKTSNQWKSYFLQVEDFLIEEANKIFTKQYNPSKAELKEIFDTPKPAVNSLTDSVTSDDEYGDISITEIPF